MATPYIYGIYTSTPGFVTLTGGDSFNILPIGGLVAPDFVITATAGALGFSFLVNGYLQVQRVALNGEDRINIGAFGTVLSDLDTVFTLGGAGGTTFSNAGQITAMNATAVASQGGDNLLTNTGTIKGTFGVQLGMGLAANDTLLNSGQIIGTSTGVTIEGGPTTLRNLGLISGVAHTGLLVLGDLNGLTTFSVYHFLYNSGQITSNALNEGAVRAEMQDANSIVNLTNTGTISGVFLAYESLGESIDNFSNSGTVNGAISLGAGGDFYMGQGGVLNGILDLGAGSDTADLRGGRIVGQIIGQGGDDSYFIDHASVAIFETFGGGTDTVYAAATCRLGAEIEALTLLDDSNFNASGNVLANTLTGNSGDNRLTGLDGNDSLRGDLGNDRVIGGLGNDSAEGGDGDDVVLGGLNNDTLRGDAGDDSLNGGAGTDYLVGGTGSDRFIFSTLKHSSNSQVLADIIGDFVQGDDLIDLSAIDANRLNATPNDTFSFITGAFSNIAGQVRAVISGPNTFVEMDVDGNGTADSTIRIVGNLTLTATDFVL